MPRPTRAEVEAVLATLPPEQHEMFLAEVRRRMAEPETKTALPVTDEDLAFEQRQQVGQDITQTVPGSVPFEVMGGIAASVPRTVAGALNIPFRAGAEALQSITGGPPVPETPLERLRAALTPKTEAGGTGQAIGELAQFFVPGLGTGGAVAQGLKAGALTAAQQGEVTPGAAVTGGLTGGMAKALSVIPPAAQKRALDVFVRMFGKKPAQEVALTKKLLPIAEDLPVGGSRSLARKSAEKSREAGAAVREAYTNPAIAGETVSRAPIQAELAGQAAALEQGGQVLNPELRAALQRRTGEIQPGTTTLEELFNLRKATGERVAQAKGFEIGRTAKTKTPKVRSLESSQQAISTELKAAQEQLRQKVLAQTGELIPSGAAADEIASAWNTASDVLGKSAPKGFNSDWVKVYVVPRLLVGSIGGGLYGGKEGGIAGAGGGIVLGAIAASNPAFWKSLSAANWRALGRFASAGNQAGATQMLSGLMAQWTKKPQTPQEELESLLRKQVEQ